MSCTHRDAQINNPFAFLSVFPCISSRLEHLAAQPVVSSGHVSELLCKGFVVSGREKKGEVAGAGDEVDVGEGAYRFIPTSNAPRSCFHNPPS